MRVFGFFPFIWKLKDEKNYKNPFKLILKKNPLLRIWSLLLTVGLGGLMLWDFYNSLRTPNNTANPSRTLTIAHTVYDGLNALGILALQTLAFHQADLLAEIMEQSRNISFSLDLKVRKFRKNYLSIILTLCGSFFSVSSLYAFYAGLNQTGLARVTLSLRYILMPTYIVLFSLLSFSFIEVAGTALKKIYRPLTKIISNGYNRLVGQRERNLVTPSTVSQEKALLSLGQLVQAPPQFDGFEPTQIRKLLKSVQSLEELDFNLVKFRTLKVFEFLHLSLEYCATLVLALLVMVVGTLLTTFFYLSMWSTMEFYYKILIVAHTTISVVPLVYIANMPTCLTDTVSSSLLFNICIGFMYYFQYLILVHFGKLLNFNKNNATQYNFVAVYPLLFFSIFLTPLHDFTEVPLKKFLI